MNYSRIIKTKNPKGWICIDDTRFPRSIGGIRLISGVTQNETELLAKAMSYKLHSFGFPMSGGKGSVDSDNILDFYSFIGKAEVRELIGADGPHQFITGPDIGTSEEEYYTALEKAGMEDLIRRGLLSKISKTYALPLDNIVTAYGVIVAAEELMKEDKNQDPLFNKHFALEGFGKVGTGIAKILTNRAKIVALSTRYGCIRAEKGNQYTKNGGFDTEKIIELQNRYGDNFIKKTGLTIYPVEALFETSCDILIPGARTEVVTSDIATKILTGNPQAVVPVSNYPYTAKGLEILSGANIICFPDFIASAGAVIAAMIEFANAGDEEEALNLVDSAIRQETRELIIATSMCDDPNKTMYEVAVEKAKANKDEILENNELETDIKMIAENTIQRYANVY